MLSLRVYYHQVDDGDHRNEEVAKFSPPAVAAACGTAVHRCAIGPHGSAWRRGHQLQVYPYDPTRDTHYAADLGISKERPLVVFVEHTAIGDRVEYLCVGETVARDMWVYFPVPVAAPSAIVAVTGCAGGAREALALLEKLNGGKA